MARLSLAPYESLSPAQRQACDEVTTGKRGKVPAPMIGWLQNAEMARRCQSLGELLRYETSMPLVQVELAIIICACHWSAHVAWKAHSAYALREGLDPAIVDAIVAHRRPVFIDETQEVIYLVSKALLQTSPVDDELYARAKTALGEAGLAELAVLLGYYTIAAFTVNTFELGLPEAFVPELTDIRQPHGA